jgi:hypothetical protein
MRKLLVVAAVSACGGSSKPATAPPPATIAPSEKPEPVAVASDPEEGGQVASAAPPAAAAPPAVASDPEEGGQVASSGQGIVATGPGIGSVGTTGASSVGASGAGAGALATGHDRAATQVKAGEPNVTGDIDRAVVKRVVKMHSNQIRYCYEKSLMQNPSLQGKVTVTFTIEKDGKVSAAKAEGVEDNLDRCIEARFKTFEFPKSPAPVTIVYPFVLAAG